MKNSKKKELARLSRPSISNLIENIEKGEQDEQEKEKSIKLVVEFKEQLEPITKNLGPPIKTSRPTQ